MLAAVLWLLPNPVAVLAAMGALSGLQFPLAYRLGLRFGGARLALLFALALALPGWSAFPLAQLTHVNVVVTCVLFGALAAIRYRERPGALRAAVLGLAMTLMLHAHPTTLLLAAALALWAVLRTPRQAVITHVACVVAIIALSLAPMLIDQWLHGTPDAGTATVYLDHLAAPVWRRLAHLLLALADYGADQVTRVWLELAGLPLHLALAANALILLAAGAGIVRVLTAPDPLRRHACILLALLLAQTVFVVALRPFTPFWMVYAHLPLIAALVAIGLDRLCDYGLHWRRLVAGAALLWTVWSVATWAYLARSPWNTLEGHAKHEHYGLMDIAEHQTLTQRVAHERTPTSDLYLIGGALCQPVTLYAHFAQIVDDSFGVGALHACGKTDAIALGGMPGATAWVGLRDYAWRQIGMRPQHWLGALGFSAPVAVWHSPQALAVVAPIDYPPRKPTIAARRFVVSGDAASSAAVIVANRVRYYGPFSVIRAQANGVDVGAAYADDATAVYRVSGSAAAAPIHWVLEIEATPQYVDVLTVADP